MEEILTGIILYHNTDDDNNMEFLTDARTHRELVKAINTGKLVIGSGAWQLFKPRQWAQSRHPSDFVSVRYGTPPIQLSPRHYDVLFGLVDGLTIQEISLRLSLTTRTVYRYVAELKQRFGTDTPAQMIALAVQMGLAPGGPASKPEN